MREKKENKEKNNNNFKFKNVNLLFPKCEIKVETTAEKYSLWPFIAKSKIHYKHKVDCSDIARTVGHLKQFAEHKPVYLKAEYKHTPGLLQKMFLGFSDTKIIIEEEGSEVEWSLESFRKNL